jgi:predicted O-linked N-acetylglucosamine transferase (SPINDLY family)
VFCSFNKTYKLTPRVFEVWMRLLKAVPGSVLWLSDVSASAMENLKREGVQRGVEAQRLVLAPRVETMAEHLGRHRHADLFLDTLPYNAHTSASDALWAGLPVLTCAGQTFASRVAGSLLNAVGMPELVTHRLEDYEALALALVRDPGRLAALRTRLAANRLTHPLFDSARFTRDLEHAYALMWENYARGNPPSDIDVRVSERQVKP